MKVIKISKPNCVPCTNVSEFLKKKKVDYVELNIKQDPSLITTYNLTGVPVVILFNDQGEEVNRVVGFNPPALSELLHLSE